MSETDRQLKDKLNTNQAMRERMCLELLQTQTNFTEIRPRLPKGGPDGGRDIEGLHKGMQRTFGAVGFINDATDTQEHRRKATAKFVEDLARATDIAATDPDAASEVFVFFTNVGLTPTIIDDLKRKAYNRNISVCEIYDRERIRIMLDCNTGYAIRQRYLDMSLTDAEQKDFFDRWGEQLQRMISTGLGDIDSMIRRLHFLAEAQSLVDQISVIVKLSRPLHEISGGDFLFQTMLMLRTHAEGLISIAFGSGSDPIIETADQFRQSGAQFSRNTKKGFSYAQLWPNSPQHERYKAVVDEAKDIDVDRWTRVGTSSGLLQIEQASIYTHYGSEPFLDRFYPTCKLIDLHRCLVIFNCDAIIAENIEEVDLVADQYHLLHLTRADFLIADGSRERIVSAADFGHLDLSTSWQTLRPADGTSAFMPDFHSKTPTRRYSADRHTSE